MVYLQSDTSISVREKVGFTKNTARRHRRVGRRAVTVTAMLHRQRYRGIEKRKRKRLDRDIDDDDV